MPYFERYNVDVVPPADPWRSRVDPKSWKKDVETQLSRIEATDSGKALLLNLFKHTQASNPFAWVVIRPFATHAPASICNAETQPLGGKSPGRPYKSIILYEPGQFREGHQCFDRKQMADPKLNRGKLADEVLFHEMTHAHRHALSLKVYDPLRFSLRKYTSFEEFISVVLTNIYMTDTSNSGSSGLRGEHRTGKALEPELSDSIAFFAASEDIYPLLTRFANEDTVMFEAMARVKAGFNPLRTLKENNSWAKAASESRQARMRDIQGGNSELKRQIAEEISGAVQAAKNVTKEPNINDLAKAVLSPFAKQALEVLKK